MEPCDEMFVFITEGGDLLPMEFPIVVADKVFGLTYTHQYYRFLYRREDAFGEIHRD